MSDKVPREMAFFVFGQCLSKLKNYNVANLLFVLVIITLTCEASLAVIAFLVNFLINLKGCL